MIKDANDNFSFSGLKTAVRYYLEKYPEALKNDQSKWDICASVQAAIIEVLTIKTLRAAVKCKVDTITLSGGVARNASLRARLQQICQEKKMVISLGANKFCAPITQLWSLV